MQETGTQTHRERVARRERRALTSHFADLGQELYALLHKEVELGATEIGDKVEQARRSTTTLAAGGAVAFSGFIVLLFAAVYGLATVWPLWLSALVVGLVVTVLGAVAIAIAANRLKASKLKPERTLRSLREDKEFAKGELQ